MFGILVLASAASALGCDLTTVTSARAVHDALSLRAIEIIGTAQQEGPEAKAYLEKRVDPTASFSLGSGDVGRPLGTGIAGAKTLASTMNADQYRFLGWDYMDFPANACGKQTVAIEFVSSRTLRLSSVEFTFDQGRVVTASGWESSFKSGAFPLPGENMTDR